MKKKKFLCPCPLVHNSAVDKGVDFWDPQIQIPVNAPKRIMQLQQIALVNHM